MSAKRYYKSEYYVQGSNALKSAVRKPERADSHYEYAQQNAVSQPVRREHLESVPDRRRDVKREHQEAVKVKKMPVQVWDFKSLLFIVAAVAITFMMCISYLQAQESITAMSKKAASLESEIMTLKNQNDAAYNRINSSVDLSYVYDVAVNELGMVHADDSQVIPYNSRKSNSVRQYGEIPEETESYSKLTSGN